MRPFLIATLLLLAGCVVYERGPYTPAPPAAPVRQVLSREQAIEVAFRLCGDRQLRVDRVDRAVLDGAGRWHVSLAGYLDRAQLLLDGRDGKLLKGRFRRLEDPPPAAPAPRPPPSLDEGGSPGDDWE